MIVNFVNIYNTNYCIIKNLEKTNTVTTEIRDRQIFGPTCSSKLNSFFIRVNVTENYKLVKLENIIRRCIRSSYIIDTIEYLIVSPCNDLKEHD